MAGIQLRLQKELFAPNDEQLFAMAHCFKLDRGGALREKSGRTSGVTAGGRRKEIYLCILNEGNPQQQPQFNINICEVKGSEKRNDLPKRKRTWALRELNLIDAKFVKDSKDSKDGSGTDFLDNTGDFDLGFTDKVFSWTAVNYEEKKRFLSALVSVVTRGQGRKYRVNMMNLPPEVEAITEDTGSKDGSASQSEVKSGWPMLTKEGDDLDTGYQAMSEKEERDLLKLMKNCDYAVSNADLFVEDLQRQLNVLDGANIHSIMASEESVEKLMVMLEEAIKNVETLESKLDGYDSLMDSTRQSMDKMNEGDFETANINNKHLLNVLESVIKQMDLPLKYQTALTEAPADFNQTHKLREAVEAAKALEKAINAEIDPLLWKLKAVKDQRKRCEKWRDKFSKAITRHLTNIIVHVGNDTDNLESSMGNQHEAELKLNRRRNIHKELKKYAELVHWLKSMDPSNFTGLQSTYRTSMKKLYDKDLRRFFENARFRVSGGKSPGLVAGSAQDLSGKKKGPNQSGLLGNDTDSLGSEFSLSERERFDDILETILIELANVCLDEQQFSMLFFKMDKPSDVRCPDSKRDKQAMEAARSMMMEIFPSLESELVNFISAYEKADSFFTLHAMVRLSKHVLSSQDTGSFLAISLGTVLVQIKRNFDKYMNLQLKSIEEARAPWRNKCGILPFISNFERFVSTTEAIFQNSERRVDLEKWYGILVGAMITAITRISVQHSKTPAEVVKMENYHHLHALLSRIKIATLDNAKKEVRNLYQDALKGYVNLYFGRPLEKLNVFFEGVQALVSAGVKEFEVGYQLAYSKQELRKVIALYPAKEVRKGLDHLYKKVERHLCEEEGLVQVVWRAMQEEFIQQYKCIEDLIQRCYPGSQISLDFTIESVLEFFSDIAQSH